MLLLMPLLIFGRIVAVLIIALLHQIRLLLLLCNCPDNNPITCLARVAVGQREGLTGFVGLGLLTGLADATDLTAAILQIALEKFRRSMPLGQNFNLLPPPS